MILLLFLALLVTGCGETVTSSPPSAAVAPSALPSPSTSPSAAAEASCHPLLRTGAAGMRPLSEQLVLAVANDDGDAIADVAFRAGQVAHEIRREVRGDDPTIVRYGELLDDLERAAEEEPASVADALPLIEALSALVEVTPEVVAACS